MSAWHRENPELVGTDADPWMIHEDYRRALSTTSDGEVAVVPPSAGSASPSVDPHCDVCGAPPGKHHLSYCDLRGSNDID